MRHSLDRSEPDRPELSRPEPSRPELDRPELAALWRAFHTRLSAGQPVARVRIGPLDEAARSALADLLGLDRLPGAHPTVSLARLDEALRDSCGQDTRSVVSAIIGPLGDRAADRASDIAERAGLWEWLAAHPVVVAQPVLGAWVAAVRRAGLIGGSVPATRRVLDDALGVLGRVPAGGEPLPVFATRTLNDSHALDDGTRLSALVLRALSVLYEAAPPETAAERRALWSRAGIADDALSTTVLTAGLRPLGSGPVARSLNTLSDAGHAAHLTLAQLRSPGELRFPPGAVHITENPSIMALALQRFGAGCPPMVCTSGWPNSAVILLLRLLAGPEGGGPDGAGPEDTSVSLRYHGDFDGEGLRIAAHVMARSTAVPWRMSASDFLRAHAPAPAGPAVGRVTEAPWDAGLAPALLRCGTAVFEEHVAEDLLTDLDTGGTHC